MCRYHVFVLAWLSEEIRTGTPGCNLFGRDPSHQTVRASIALPSVSLITLRLHVSMTHSGTGRGPVSVLDADPEERDGASIAWIN